MKPKTRVFSTGKFVLFFLISGLFPVSLAAQAVMTNLRVNTSDYTEVQLDGAGKLHAFYGSNVYAIWQGKTSGTESDIYFAGSADGGQSFSAEAKIYTGEVTALHVWPSLAVSQNGNIYIAWVAVTDDEGSEKYNIWFTRSVDGGSTFSDPLVLTAGGSCVLPAIAAYGQYVYILYVDASNYPQADYYFLRSDDNGDSFGSAVQANDLPCAGTVKFEGLTNITTDGSGNLYMVWVDGRRSEGNGDIFISKSTDNGVSFSADVMVNDVNESRANSVQYLPSVAADASNVYVSFTDMSLGDEWTDNRVYIAKSVDGGSSFSTESLFNGHNYTAKYHDLTISPDGSLLAAVCTFIEPNWGVWLYRSADGGTSYSSPLALSDVLDKNYSDVRIISKTDQEIQALWKDDREGADDNNIYFTKTDLSLGRTFLELEDSYSIYPNPATGKFTIIIPYECDESEISIYNFAGLQVYKKRFGNTSKIDIQADIPPGNYFVKVNTSHGSQTLKLVKK